MMPACVVPLLLALLLFDSNSSPSFSILSTTPFPFFLFFDRARKSLSKEGKKKKKLLLLSLSRGAEPATYKDDVFVGGRRFLEREREREISAPALSSSLFLGVFLSSLGVFSFFHSLFLSPLHFLLLKSTTPLKMNPSSREKNENGRSGGAMENSIPLSLCP
jgi:hypothetical protein